MRLILFCYLLIVAPVQAHADPVTLVCSGTFREFPKPEAKLGATSVTIDLDQNIIKTPLGDFLITRIENNSVVFGQPTKTGSVGGNIDRISGSMSIFWLTAEQKEASKKGPFKYEMFASLECAPAKRMF